jgi:hypothetical protein
MTTSLQDLLASITPVDAEEDVKMTGIKARVAANTGRTNTPETILRMSQAQLGKVRTAEHRRKVSLALTGKPRPDVAAALTGRKLDKEAGAKMGATNSANARKKLEAFFAPQRDVLERAYANPVMQQSGSRINWPATSERHQLSVALLAKFFNARKLGKI